MAEPPTGRVKLNADGVMIRSLLAYGASSLSELAPELERLGARRSAACILDARDRIEEAAQYLDELVQ